MKESINVGIIFNIIILIIVITIMVQTLVYRAYAKFTLERKKFKSNNQYNWNQIHATITLLTGTFLICD